MSYDRPTKTWAVRDIDRMLQLLDEIERPGFVAYTLWTQPKESIEPNSIPMTFPDYHPVVKELIDLLYKSSAWIDPYAALPEDPVQEDVPFSVLGVSYSLAYFETATLNQVRRYLVLLSRGERFCDGHIAGEFNRGAVLAALRRLRALRSKTLVKPREGK